MSNGPRIPVSVFIIAKDEAHRIGLTIESVRDLVEEVVVVEWGSADQTAEVARSLGARVFHHPWEGYGRQKRFAEDQCRSRWLMNLDADEALSPELQEELVQLFSTGAPGHDAYRLVIRAVCNHEQRPTRGAYANSPIRLYDRERGRFSESPVHDSVIMQAGTRVGKLRGDVYHRGIISFTQLISKINHYTTMQANDYVRRKNARVPWWKLLTVFPGAFLKSYFLRRHFVWGRYGFSISVSYAFARLLRLTKILEHELADQSPPVVSIDQTDSSSRRAA